MDPLDFFVVALKKKKRLTKMFPERDILLLKT